MRTAQVGLVVAAFVWLAAIAFAPAAAFPIGRFICHQRPERSFFFHGSQFAVCARCTGLYAGAAAAGPVALWLAASVSPRRARWALGLAAVPSLASWLLEFAAGVPVSNGWRFVAALPLGFAAAWVVLGEIGHRTTDVGRRTGVR